MKFFWEVFVELVKFFWGVSWHPRSPAACR